MQIVFTRILSGAYSLARDFVRLIPAARDTLVGNPRADGVLAPRLVTLMMRPPPRPSLPPVRLATLPPSPRSSIRVSLPGCRGQVLHYDIAIGILITTSGA